MRGEGAGAVVLTTGTFLNGLMHVGDRQQSGGRAGDRAAVGLTAALWAGTLQAGAATSKAIIEDPLGDANFVNDQGTGDGSFGDFNQAGVLGGKRLTVLPVWELLFEKIPDGAVPIATALSMFLRAAGIIEPAHALAVFSPHTHRIATRCGFGEVWLYERAGEDWVPASP